MPLGVCVETYRRWRARQLARARREQAAREFASTPSQSDRRHTPWTRLTSIEGLTKKVRFELQALQTDSQQAVTDFEATIKCHNSFVVSMMAVDNCAGEAYTFPANEEIILEHKALQVALEQAEHDLRRANDWQGRLQHRIESMEKMLKDKASELQALHAARVQAARDLVEKTWAAIESTKQIMEQAAAAVGGSSLERTELEQAAAAVSKVLVRTEQKACEIAKELEQMKAAEAIAGELIVADPLGPRFS